MIYPVNTLRRFLLVGTLVLATQSVRTATTIYPVEAIDDLWQLPADDFRQKYAGINVTGIGPGDEGWYVRYRHENLTYLFGPLADTELARKKKWEMEAVRDAAIRTKASLNTSKVDYVRFTYSGVYGKGGGNTPYSGKAGKEGAGGEGEGAEGQGGGAGGKDGSGGAGEDGSGKAGNGTGSGADGDKDGTGGGAKLAGLGNGAGDGDGTGDGQGGA
eukprot:gene66431-90936_t